MSIHLKSAFWKKLETIKTYWCVCVDNFSIIENFDGNLLIRCFISYKAAETYKNDMVERLNYPPSTLYCKSFSLPEVMSLSKEFIQLSPDIRDLSIKIMLTDFRNDEIIIEESVYDSQVYIN